MFSTIMRSLSHNQHKRTHLQDACKGYLVQPKQVIATQKMFQSPYSKIRAFDFGGAQKTLGELNMNVEEFEDKIIHSEFPYIVNFHAEWCEPCLPVTLAVKKAVHESQFVCLTNIVPEENVELTMSFKIEVLPTVLAFNQGDLVQKLVGLVSNEEVEDLVIKMDKSYKNRFTMSKKG